MTIQDIEQKAWELKGSTNYWDNVHSIQDDLELLNLLANRIKTCSYPLEVHIRDRAFDKIFQMWCYNTSYTQDAYATFVVLESLIMDIYNETHQYTEDEMAEYFQWFYDCDIDVVEYVRYFIDCSRGISGTMVEVSKLLKKWGIGDYEIHQQRVAD